MIIQKYGIHLKRVTPEMLEMLRNWRNNPEIAKFMSFRDYISPDMQTRWFEGINTPNHFFFVVEYMGKDIGLINTSNINYNVLNADTGLYIADESFLRTQIPVLASLAMLDVFFGFFHLNHVYAKVKDDNVAALNYNAALGFIPTQKQTAEGFAFYNLTAQRYISHAKQLRVAAMKLYSNTTHIFLNDTDDNTLIKKLHNEAKPNAGFETKLLVYND